MTNIAVHTRPWTPRITLHEVGARGARSRVYVLADSKSGNLSWSGGKYRSVEDAERMIAELSKAVELYYALGVTHNLGAPEATVPPSP